MVSSNYILLYSRESSPWYSVKSGETIMYTWDDPTANRSLKWGLKGTKVSKSLDVTKVRYDMIKCV